MLMYIIKANKRRIYYLARWTRVETFNRADRTFTGTFVPFAWLTPVRAPRSKPRWLLQRVEPSRKLAYRTPTSRDGASPLRALALRASCSLAFLIRATGRF